MEVHTWKVRSMRPEMERNSRKRFIKTAKILNNKQIKRTLARNTVIK